MSGDGCGSLEIAPTPGPSTRRVSLRVRNTQRQRRPRATGIKSSGRGGRKPGPAAASPAAPGRPPRAACGRQRGAEVG